MPLRTPVTLSNTIQPCNLVLTFCSDRTVSIQDRIRGCLRDLHTIVCELLDIRQVAESSDPSRVREVVDQIPLGACQAAQHNFVLKLFHGPNLNAVAHFGPGIEELTLDHDTGLLVRTGATHPELNGVYSLLWRLWEIGAALRGFLSLLDERSLPGGFQVSDEVLQDCDQLTDGLFSKRIREAQTRQMRDAQRIAARQTPQAPAIRAMSRRIRHLMSDRSPRADHEVTDATAEATSPLAAS
jgi:hypothetical protein